MPRITLTGAPGAGKTTIVNELSARGYVTEPEVATPLILELQSAGIPEPWNRAEFPEQIATLQLAVLSRAAHGLEIHDRSPICTLALARYLGHDVGPTLARAVELACELLVRTALLIEPTGSIERTAVRAMSYEMALEFEQVHIDTYEECGFELIRIAPGTVIERTDEVCEGVEALLHN